LSLRVDPKSKKNIPCWVASVLELRASLV
jgi:hypothetical protein